jgi:Peptidase_C39 like family
VPTDLFLAASAWLSEHLAAAVPPSCFRGIDRAPSPEADGNDVVIVLPEWRPRVPSRRLVPAFSIGEGVQGFRFELATFAAGAWSPYVAGAAVGRDPFAPVPARAGTLAAEIDEFVATPPAERVRLVLRVSAADLGALRASPWFVSLSAWSPSAPVPAPIGGGAELAVPAFSQMEEDSAIRSRICSPASVAMVLAYYGARVPVAELAREIFHAELELYGVWPAAVSAAGRRGVAGFLLRFPDWAAAAWCLERGVPIIASVRYGAGELTGAAIDQTTGHLLVLTGYAGSEVLVNDPAAPTTAEVRRWYRRDELERVWLERAGIGYVLFMPPAGHR